MRFMKPMLVSSLPEGNTIHDYDETYFSMEEKHDGHRVLMHKDEHGIVAWSRSGKLRTIPASLLQHIHVALRYGTYDGELYVPGHTSTDVRALKESTKLRYCVFDIMQDQTGLSLCDTQLWKRRQILGKHFSVRNYNEVHRQTVHAVSKERLDEIWARGSEGVVIKHNESKYLPGKRSSDWIRIKEQGTADVSVSRFEPGKLGPHSIIVALDAKGVTVRVKAKNNDWRTHFAKLGSLHFHGARLRITYAKKTQTGHYQQPRADHFLEGY